MTDEEGRARREGRGVGRIIKYEGEVPLPPIPNVNYASLVMDMFPEFGENIALVDATTKKSYTYGDLLRMVPKIRNGLIAAGVCPGDCVILISTNHINMPLVILSVILLGATCVPLNPASTKEELAHAIRVSEAKWAMANSKVVEKVEEAFKSLAPGSLKQIWVLDDTPRTTRLTLSDLLKSASSEPTKTNEDFDSAKAIALMPFSSGTTGLPKGVMLSHRNLIVLLVQSKFYRTLNPDAASVYEAALLVIPMFHMYGFNVMMAGFFSGGKSITLTKFSPKDYFEAIQRYKVTFSPIVPYIINFLVDTPLMEKYDLSSLKIFVTGTAPISEKKLDGLIDKTGVFALHGYGMTESSGNGSINTGAGGYKPNTVGQFGPFLLAKVIDVKTGDVLGEGEEGELCLGGPSIMVGYANNPKATAETIDSEGWLHTGDLVWYDEDNYFFISGRIKDLIKVKGYQVSPEELEKIIQQVTDVGEVAVAGVPHERLGEAPRAWVVPAKGAIIDKKALIKHVADNVAPFKQLAGGVEVVKTLPRNTMGKVLRKQLTQSYMASRSKL